MTSNILKRILASKQKSVEELKERIPLKEMEAQSEKVKPGRSFIRAVSNSGQVSIIAEMKKASPSAGELVKKYDPTKIAKVYAAAGVRAISVLTEEKYFQGRPDHIGMVREAVSLPVLRKDFLFDPYQLFESRTLGVSAVLLIVAALKKEKFFHLLKLCRDLKLDALVEVHSEPELEIALKGGSRCIGINNRNLKNLSVDINTTFRLLRSIPKTVCVISESGIQSPETVQELKKAGIRAALIGESILKSGSMEKTVKAFVKAGL